MFWKTKPSVDLGRPPSREFVIRHGRILIVDDERPSLIDDLWSRGFAVTYLPDLTSANLALVDRPIFDVLLLDYAGVGKTLGPDEGLEVLKYVKQHNPAIVVLTYTSKAISTKQSDFFRLADGTLGKDQGVQESIEKIEQALQSSLSVERLWKSTLSVAGIGAGSRAESALREQLQSVASGRASVATLRSSLMRGIDNPLGKVIVSELLKKVLENVIDIVGF